ncbi:hypothetical protein LCGC14_0549870 [marine sediment metagenome]|uniref:Uncharacterized protein n=1 Tax=marine sediment metagenome TaxID=412755 RepID=A0A0F9RQD7_9ZZZZ
MPEKHKFWGQQEQAIFQTKIEAIVPYCRDCNVKLKTKAGVASHTNQGHEVLEMTILEPEPDMRASSLIMKHNENQPYEIIHGIDYSEKF